MNIGAAATARQPASAGPTRPPVNVPQEPNNTTRDSPCNAHKLTRALISRVDGEPGGVFEIYAGTGLPLIFISMDAVHRHFERTDALERLQRRTGAPFGEPGAHGVRTHVQPEFGDVAL